MRYFAAGRNFLTIMGIFTRKQKKMPENGEIKGYYGPEPEGISPNEFFRAIRDYLRGFELPPVTVMIREQIKTAYETSAPVMGVVNKIARAVGEVLPYLELQDAGGNYIENHWLLDLLGRPNDRFSTYKFGEAWAINKLLFGDAWVYAPKRVGARKGQVSEMYIIPSHIIEIDRGGEVQPMKGIRLQGSPKAGELDMTQVFESFDYNLDATSFFGTSKIVAASVYLTVMERSMNREATALNNGGVANIITPAKDNLGVLAKDADTVEERFNSKSNVNKTLAFRIPIEVHELGSAPVDLGILDSHKMSIEALCFVFGLPVDLYYGQSKYENAKEAKKTVYESLAIPMANEFAQDLLRHTGLDRQGYRLTVNTEHIDVLKEKSSDTMQTLNLMHASLNELREANGYDPIEEPWADQPILPLGVMFGNEILPEEDIDENAPAEGEEQQEE